MSLVRLYDSVKQFVAKSGVPMSGGKVKVFLHNTDDLASLYADAAGTTPLPNPMSIDTDGRTLGVFVADGSLYRIEVYGGVFGNLEWTVDNVTGGSGGGGNSGVTDIVSSDGSISVDKTTVGPLTTFDLSSRVEDSTELLGWIRCDGGVNLSGTNVWKPTYTDGTLIVGDQGVMLSAGEYFHATARVRVMKGGVSSFYDDMLLVFKLSDGVASTEVARQGIVVDGSMGLYQDFEISCDTLPESDCELVLEITGKELPVLTIQLLDMEVHRIYSGAPYIPGGVAPKPWVAENYQEKLTAGSNIVIDPSTNTISATAEPQEQADWAQSDSTAVDYIKNKPDLSEYATDAELTAGLSTKQDVISDLATIRAGAALGATAVQDSGYVHTDNNFTNADVTKLSGIESGAEVNVQANWSESDSSSDAYIQNKPAIPSGSQLVPSATPSDAGDVLTVDQNGTPAWAPAQAPISAGNGVDITNNVVSAKVDGTSVTFNANGELEATATVPPLKPVVAGANITITENQNDITIAAAGTSYSAGTGIAIANDTISVDTSVVALKSELPTIGTVTL